MLGGVSVEVFMSRAKEWKSVIPRVVAKVSREGGVEGKVLKL